MKRGSKVYCLDLFANTTTIQRWGGLFSERTTRRVVDDLSHDDIVYMPYKKDGTYSRVYNYHSLSPEDRVLVDKYMKSELKKAISHIKHIRRIQRFAQNEENKRLMGELELL